MSSEFEFCHDDKIDWPTSHTDYELLEAIGMGASATVYRAMRKDTGTFVAIKVIDMDRFDVVVDEIRKETGIMHSLDHVNLVHIHVSFVASSCVWMIMDLFEAGSCASALTALAPRGFKDEALVATLLYHTLEGLGYLHKNSFVHRDVKGSNVLLSSTGMVALADFGVATGLSRGPRSTFTGTPAWMSPEIMEQETGYDEKADLWSFGILALELAYGRAPYARFEPMKAMLLTLQEDPPTADLYNDRSFDFSKSFHRLVAKCLVKDPKKRPTVKKLLDHEFFKQKKNSEYVVEKLIHPLQQVGNLVSLKQD
ncbi:MAG: hypothetical protein Sylvanvirus14_7 [Sylvanvirus sp.]|uniref:Protein kinase domain-containing protein n=1 Tax=Sylvanvirus sp. TaxID=2487774 RepID=A0A3G5AI75_9VIRU|nr:MAG: hypothetical protein Sylvanvirus14_7 [Sylvanvirus sp.]